MIASLVTGGLGIHLAIAAAGAATSEQLGVWEWGPGTEKMANRLEQIAKPVIPIANRDLSRERMLQYRLLLPTEQDAIAVNHAIEALTTCNYDFALQSNQPNGLLDRKELEIDEWPVRAQAKALLVIDRRPVLVAQ